MKLEGLLIAAAALFACSSSPDAPESALAHAATACNEPDHACTWLGLPGQEGFNGDGHRREETMIYWSMDMAFGADGITWFIDWNNHMVRRVMPDQTVETVLGSTEIPGFPGDGGPGENTAEGALGTTVALNHPTDLAFDRDGTLLVMAWHNHKLRTLNPDSLYAHIECGAGPGFRGDGMAASMALFKQP